MKIIICVGNVEIQVEHEVGSHLDLIKLVQATTDEFIKVLNNIIIEHEGKKQGGIIKNRKDAII